LSLNHIILQGRLTKDPEKRYTKTEKPVATFTLAVDRDFGEGVDFINVTAWDKTADFVEKYFTKGSMAIVSGRLQMREWTDKNENKRISAEVVAERVYFGESKGKKTSAIAVDASTFSELPDDDGGELPF